MGSYHPSSAESSWRILRNWLLTLE
jgi:hypothetical protein